MTPFEVGQTIIGASGVVVGIVFGILGVCKADSVRKVLSRNKEVMDTSIWGKIIADLTQNPRDLQTVPLKGHGHWFYAEIEGECVKVSDAKEHSQSSQLSAPRTISQAECEALYPLYLRRKEGEQVSREAQKKSWNQVYIYAILESCGGV